MQRRKQRRQLRNDGVIVVARIGDQCLRQRHPHSRDAAVNSRDVLGRAACDIAERAARIALRFLPAHPSEPELGSPVIIGRIERVDVRRPHRTAAVEAVQLKRRATRVRGAAVQFSRDRQRYGGVHQIVGDELQQIGVARGNRRVFPVLERAALPRGPADLGIHAARQAVHQRPDFFQVHRRIQGIDVEDAKSLGCPGTAEEMTKAGRSFATAGIGDQIGLGSRQRGSIGIVCSHRGVLDRVLILRLDVSMLSFS